MLEQTGLRERKKQRTRRALVETAARLFAEHGYEGTTVDQIAAEADVATRTFFSYFRSKEDVLFAATDERIRIPLRVVADRQPGETPAQLLRRAVEQTLDSEALTDDLDAPVGGVRLHLLLSTPSLQAAGLRRLFTVQTELAEALKDAFPGKLDDTTAAAAVGAVYGALLSAALQTLHHSGDLTELRVALRQALAIVEDGVAVLPAENAPEATASES